MRLRKAPRAGASIPMELGCISLTYVHAFSNVEALWTLPFGVLWRLHYPGAIDWNIDYWWSAQPLSPLPRWSRAKSSAFYSLADSEASIPSLSMCPSHQSSHWQAKTLTTSEIPGELCAKKERRAEMEPASLIMPQWQSHHSAEEFPAVEDHFNHEWENLNVLTRRAGKEVMVTVQGTV